MKRIRVLVMVGVLAAFLAFGGGLAYAYGDWFWNAQIDVQGVDVRTQWQVVDEDGVALHGEEDSYRATIRVVLPRDAEASIVARAATESVALTSSAKLECSADGIEARVLYKVKDIGNDALSDTVIVTVTADGVVVGTASGGFGEKIELNVSIPGSC